MHEIFTRSAANRCLRRRAREFGAVEKQSSPDIWRRSSLGSASGIAEAEVQHEIATYNELVGEAGELVCTLLIEIEDKEKRQELLSRWKDLPEAIYIKTSSGRTVPASFDRQQVGEGRISSVQYLKFRIGDDIPRGLGTNQSDIAAEAQLLPEQVAALVQDLISR
jgi:hypothetical protein